VQKPVSIIHLKESSKGDSTVEVRKSESIKEKGWKAITESKQ